MAAATPPASVDAHMTSTMRRLDAIEQVLRQQDASVSSITAAARQTLDPTSSAVHKAKATSTKAARATSRTPGAKHSTPASRGRAANIKQAPAKKQAPRRRGRSAALARLPEHLLTHCIAVSASRDRTFKRYLMLCLVAPRWHDCVHEHFRVLLRHSECLLEEPEMKAIEVTVRSVKSSLDDITFDPEQLSRTVATGNLRFTYGSPGSRHQRYKIPVFRALFHLVGDTKPCSTHSSIQGRLGDPDSIREFLLQMDVLSITLPDADDAKWESAQTALDLIHPEDARDQQSDWAVYEGLHSAVRKLVAARSARDVLAAIPQGQLRALREAMRNREWLGRITSHGSAAK